VLNWSDIELIEPGGALRIRYRFGPSTKNPVVQVRGAMFDIKNATERAFAGQLTLRFQCWVAFPFITSAQWIARFGADAYRSVQFLFTEDLSPEHLGRRLGASNRSRGDKPISLCPLDQLQCVWSAFGDTSVLYASRNTRPQRSTREGTLGEQVDEAAEAYKELSDDQKRLSEMDWEGGPRLVRGVAGSGKTIVLANNLARRFARMRRGEELFQMARGPRTLAVCFNRTLAPFIRGKIETAYEQRTGEKLAEGSVQVFSFNKLMYALAQARLWEYQHVKYLDQIVHALPRHA